MVENAKGREGPPRHSEEEKALAFAARGCPGPLVPESFHLRASGAFAVDKSLMISKNAMDVDRREWWIAGPWEFSQSVEMAMDPLVDLLDSATI